MFDEVLKSPGLSRETWQIAFFLFYASGSEKRKDQECYGENRSDLEKRWKFCI